MYPFSYFLGQKNKHNCGGAEEARTPNLFAASEMLYQLSYSPVFMNKVMNCKVKMSDEDQLLILHLIVCNQKCTQL